MIEIIISLCFVPWPIVKVWIAPLPKTVQEQVNKANDYGFDGIIVYIDEKDKNPGCYSDTTLNKATTYLF